MKKYALEVNELNAAIGGFNLSNIDLKLEKGTITGLVGKNGAGKTTLIKTILSIILKKHGEVLFFGKTLDGNEVEIKSRIGVVFDNLIYPQYLNAMKVRKLISPFYPSFDDNIFDDLMNRFNLDSNKKLKDYSRGMQMKFSMVMALSHNPNLIILDEPTAGLDPVARADVLELLYEIIQDDEKTILFSTHITSDLDKIADYIVMIDNGKIVFSEAKDEMLDRHYLINMDNETMNDRIKEMFVGLKKTSFGYEGLSMDKAICLLEGVKVTRPTIEDIMIYKDGFRQ